MARYRYGHKKSNYRYRKRNIGAEIAAKHIAEGDDFIAEIGGSVQDVQKYFFSLNNNRLNVVLNKYENEFGEKAGQYARKTFPKWKNGSTKMSGLVMKRLFSFLPPMMSFKEKLDLAQSVWNHSSPFSDDHLTIGPEADLKVLQSRSEAIIRNRIEDHRIPNDIKNRFDWLSGGDIHVKEQLLNYFRNMEKETVISVIENHVGILKSQMQDQKAITHRASTSFCVGKHNLTIHINKNIGEEIKEGNHSTFNESFGGTSLDGIGKFIVWSLIIAIILFLISGLR